MNTLTPADVQGNLRRLENLVATKNFTDALENLANNPRDLDGATKDTKAYLASFGLMMPEEAKVTLEPDSGTGDFQVQGFCIRVCRGNTCVTICVHEK